MDMREQEDTRPGIHLVVVIPCLNEEMTISTVVAGVPQDVEGIDSIEILVMDDGSTDETAARARDAGANVFSHATNQGLGATFKDACRLALTKGADVMVHIDGDGQFNPADIPTLVAPIINEQAHMATASRFMDRALIPNMPTVKLWGNRGVARIVWLLTGKRFQDVSCGFRAFSREALLRMNLFGNYTYTQETFLDLVFKGLEIKELPVKVRGTREFGKSRMASNIPLYAFRALQIMMRAFISYRPFSFFICVSGVFFVTALVLLGFLLAHYLNTGAFSPHIWAGFVGGSFGFLGILTLIMGVIGDMLVRIRLNQEEILYNLKKNAPTSELGPTAPATNSEKGDLSGLPERSMNHIKSQKET